MKHLFQLRIIALFLLMQSLISNSVLACSSCSCTLNSDWGNLGISTLRGYKVDFRYDYLNQDQLRNGSSSISSLAASKIAHDGELHEVESYTKNHYLNFGVEYNLESDLGFSVQLPYVIRSHATLGAGSDGITSVDSGGQYNSSTSNIGDLKLMMRYQSFIPALNNFGALMGVKLPTGSYSEMGTSSDTAVPGSVAIDRGIQPGTGTTDVILGIYYFDGVTSNLHYFVQAIFQKALYSKENFKAGDAYNLDLGLRYSRFKTVVPQIQLNGRFSQAYVGANADEHGTGGVLLYATPGVVAPLHKLLLIYGFIQVPIYQNVEGVQLTPAFTPSIGIRTSF